MSQETATWSLSPLEYAATQAKVAKINQRAAKRGFTGRIEVSGSTRELSEVDASGLRRVRIVVETIISGEPPRYNGWTFLAAVDSIDTEAGDAFVLRTAPGIEESGVDRSKLVAGHCEHCGTARSNRRYTYLVKHDDGRLSQVGSTCIKDFTGWSGKPVFINVAAVRDELNEMLGQAHAVVEHYSPTTVIAVAWAISRRFGWVGASAAGDGRVATRDHVNAYLYGRSTADEELRRDLTGDVAQANQKAVEIRSTLLNELEGSSDYVTNLLTCLRAPQVEARHMGIVVSAIAAYDRLTGEHARRKASAEAAAAQREGSRHLGAIGDKLTVTGVVTLAKQIDADYGPSMLVLVQTEGSVVKFFTGASWVWEVEQGDEVTLVGTVKSHDEYRETKQTMLSRPRLTTLS